MPTELHQEASSALVHGVLDIEVIHVFNQWQRIARTALQLNGVLNFPLPRPKFHQRYDGAWAYRIFTNRSLEDIEIQRLIDFPLFDTLYRAATDGLNVVAAPQAVPRKSGKKASPTSPGAAARAKREKQSLPNAFAVLEIEDTPSEEVDSDEEQGTENSSAQPWITVGHRSKIAPSQRVGGRRFPQKARQRKT